MSSLETLKKHLINIPGWRTDRKIVVIESDDWGSIRMASKEAYCRLLKKGYSVNKCAYNKNDALESNQDLEMLMEVLDSVKDSRGNPALFTINNIMANPDFEKIKVSNFQEYYYEPFTETLKRYHGRDRVMELYQQGIKRNVLKPQFHGREHLNINRWIEDLQKGKKALLDAFEEKMLPVPLGRHTSGRRNYLDAFGEAYEKEIEPLENIIREGLNLFNDIWGFPSSTFIAPCYTWSPSLEKKFKEFGIEGMQGTYVQRIPMAKVRNGVKRRYHYQGQKNSYGQRYLVRNVFFEPTENSSSKAVANALTDIRAAFQHNKPAIVQTHRLNYIGSIREANRLRSLKLLNELLTKITKKYPEVEFMSSDQLLKLIKS